MLGVCESAAAGEAPFTSAARSFPPPYIVLPAAPAPRFKRKRRNEGKTVAGHSNDLDPVKQRVILCFLFNRGERFFRII